jgi:hypothetical protein
VLIFIGSVVSYFSTNLSTLGTVRSAQVAVNNLVNNPSLGPLTVSSVSVNSRTYNAAPTGSTSNSQSSNTGLIVGLVVGLVGGAILIAGSVFGYRKYQKKKRGQRLINDEPDVESGWPSQSAQNNENTTSPSKSTNNGVNVTRRVSISSPDLLNIDKNRLHLPLSINANEQRVPSAAMSVTMLDCMTPATTSSNTKMPAVELIKFD